VALLLQRTRKGRERIERLEVRRASGRPGDPAELVSRTILRPPRRIPATAVKRLLEQAVKKEV
jgi:hypothetical protein